MPAHDPTASASAAPASGASGRETGGDHETTTTENGAFSVARCGCGWQGPARRSRDRARADAAAHARPGAVPPPRPPAS
ncbi:MULTISPECIES: hypothetical protein [Streptomyces]|uniref:Uncharacterized protein n=1 Tax=Streptomyces lichenis TaxID=2306967 RepID=A0ABT0IJT2_9ACTN|nr:hypothetical protein [Streptomyces lichenis]MCK8681562.1 hypothetical protein [Streptomyces lichenis]